MKPILNDNTYYDASECQTTSMGGQQSPGATGNRTVSQSYKMTRAEIDAHRDESGHLGQTKDSSRFNLINEKPLHHGRP